MSYEELRLRHTHSRMLKKSASVVLGSSKSSTGTLPPHISAARTNVVLVMRRTVRRRGYGSGFDAPAALFGRRRVSARQGWAGETSGLFERPAGHLLLVPDVQTSKILACHNCFSPGY